MITANVILRVFRIACGNQAGTAFTVDVENKQYLVTARHVVNTLKGKETISVFARGNWQDLSIELVGHATGEPDVSVLAPTRQLTPAHLTMPASMEGMTYGQDAFFLGFPYDIQSQFIVGDDGFPMPLVKRALVSSFARGFLLLDGHNNPGFSGGPVVFKKAGSSAFMAAAIVSNYQAVDEPVYLGDRKTKLSYLYNTGIIVAYGTSHALDLIKANPIGFQL